MHFYMAEIHVYMVDYVLYMPWKHGGSDVVLVKDPIKNFNATNYNIIQSFIQYFIPPFREYVRYIQYNLNSCQGVCTNLLIDI